MGLREVLGARATVAHSAKCCCFDSALTVPSRVKPGTASDVMCCKFWAGV
jgi:hypothetical protein